MDGHNRLYVSAFGMSHNERTGITGATVDLEQSDVRVYDLARNFLLQSIFAGKFPLFEQLINASHISISQSGIVKVIGDLAAHPAGVYIDCLLDAHQVKRMAQLIRTIGLSQVQSGYQARDEFTGEDYLPLVQGFLEEFVSAYATRTT